MARFCCFLLFFINMVSFLSMAADNVTSDPGSGMAEDSTTIATSMELTTTVTTIATATTTSGSAASIQVWSLQLLILFQFAFCYTKYFVMS